jgi:hypothetical protein
MKKEMMNRENKKREIKNRKRGTMKGREQRKIDRGREDKWPILFIFNDGYNCKLTTIK